MAAYVLTVGNDTFVGGNSNDTFDGYTLDNGVGTTGGVDELKGGGGADLFMLNSEYSLVAGSIDGEIGTDTVRTYGFDMGTLVFSNVEILSIESYSFGAQISQLNEFATITTSISPTQQLRIYGLGTGGTIDFSTRITGGLSLEYSGVSNTSGFNVTGTSNNDVFQSSVYDDIMHGGAGDDDFSAMYSNYSSGGVDAMFGGAGNDTFSVRRQAGTIDGGSGNDTVLAYQFSSQGIYSPGDLSTLTFTNVERLISGPAITFSLLSQLNSFNTITGGDSEKLIRFDLSGGPGGSIDFSTKLKKADEHIFFRAFKATSAVQVNATAGDDVLSGSDFADTLTGANGNDTLDGESGIDTMIGGAGNDTYQTDGTDTLIETLTGAAGGIDTVCSSISFDLKGSARLHGDFENLTLNGFGASNGFGNDFDNVLIGSGYDNVLNGRAGADFMRGGSGNDTFVVDNVGDVVQEIDWRNDGTDTVRSSINFDLSDTVKAIGYIENVVLLGIDSLNATGNVLDNRLTGNSGNNVLTGNGGNDLLVGHDGDDVLIGGNGNDRLTGGNGADSMDGGAGIDRADYSDATAGVTADLRVAANNTRSATGDTYISIEDLSGSDFNDNLRGDNGGNTIWGLGGDDKIYGYAGNDKLIGGGGNDQFFFNTALNATTNVDRITDFDVGADTIVLRQTIFSAILGTGTLTAAQFSDNNAGTAQDADDRIVYEADTGKLFFDSNGNAAGGSVQFAALSTGVALTNASFSIL
jgi:Ca2+-binding RTX toxin-like protein